MAAPFAIHLRIYDTEDNLIAFNSYDYEQGYSLEIQRCISEHFASSDPFLSSQIYYHLGVFNQGFFDIDNNIEDLTDFSIKGVNIKANDLKVAYIPAATTSSEITLDNQIIIEWENENDYLYKYVYQEDNGYYYLDLKIVSTKTEIPDYIYVRVYDTEDNLMSFDPIDYNEGYSFKLEQESSQEMLRGFIQIRPNVTQSYESIIPYYSLSLETKLYLPQTGTEYLLSETELAAIQICYKNELDNPFRRVPIAQSKDDPDSLSQIYVTYGDQYLYYDDSNYYLYLKMIEPLDESTLYVRVYNDKKELKLFNDDTDFRKGYSFKIISPILTDGKLSIEYSLRILSHGFFSSTDLKTYINSQLQIKHVFIVDKNNLVPVITVPLKVGETIDVSSKNLYVYHENNKLFLNLQIIEDFIFNDDPFLYFTFDGVNSKDLKILRTTSSNRLSINLTPAFKDNFSNVASKAGSEYLNTEIQNKEIDINFSFQDLTRLEIQKLNQTFPVNKMSELILHEYPYKTYIGKVKAPITISFLPFEETDSKTTFSGDGKISFVCYPYAKCDDEKQYIKYYNDYLNRSKYGAYEDWQPILGLRKEDYLTVSDNNSMLSQANPNRMVVNSNSQSLNNSEVFVNGIFEESDSQNSLLRGLDQPISSTSFQTTVVNYGDLEVNPIIKLHLSKHTDLLNNPFNFTISDTKTQGLISNSNNFMEINFSPSNLSGDEVTVIIDCNLKTIYATYYVEVQGGLMELFTKNITNSMINGDFISIPPSASPLTFYLEFNNSDSLSNPSESYIKFPFLYY